MAERELDALVVRAPDAILYLTNFWGMKGYDACVFPREGEPILICLEASAADAARTAWTSDVRLFPGYSATDPRAAGTAGARARRAGRARARARRNRAERRHAGLRSHGRRADDVRPRLVRRVPGGRGRDAAARAGALAQDGAGGRAHAPGQRDRRGGHGAHARDPAAGHDLRAGRRRLAGVRARRGHGLEGQGRPRAAVLADLVGAVDPHVHGDLRRAGAGGRADALRDLGVCRRLLGRSHEEPRLRRAEAALSRARAGSPGGLRRGRRLGPAGPQLRRARPPRARGHRRPRLSGPALAPDPARHRRARARAALRPPGRRGGDPRGHGAGDRARLLLAGGRRACASRTISSSPRPGPRSSAPSRMGS